MSTRKTGSLREEEAGRFLEQAGIRILEKNFRSRRGEIDLVGHDGEFLVFFEVKYRSGPGCGSPEEAVGALKQHKICRASDYYRYLHNIGDDAPVRYDVIAMTDREIKWFKNAFEYIG